MGEYIIASSMTNQMIIDSFKYLVYAELKKSLPGCYEFYYGCQEGRVSGLAYMFGESDEKTVMRSFSRKESWIHITEAIVKQKLTKYVKLFENSNEDIGDKEVKSAVDIAVNEYALEHPKEFIRSLKHNL